MPAKGARSAKLKTVNGKLVSAKSKTGDPACSAAASALSLAKKLGGLPKNIAMVLADCRKKARQDKGAALAQASGKLAPGRGTWARSDKAKALLAKRGPRPAAAIAQHKAQDPAPSPRPASSPPGHTYGSVGHVDAAFHGSPGAKDNFVKLADLRERMGGTREQQDAAIRSHRLAGRLSLDSHEGLATTKGGKPELERMKAAAIHEGGSRLVYASHNDAGASRSAPAPAKPVAVAPAFGLKTESAKGVKRTTFASSSGKTGTMFDMKKGDLPGQTSLMDRVGTVPTAPAAMSAQERRALVRTMPRVSGGSPAAILERAKNDTVARQRRARQIARLRSEAASARVDPSTHTDHKPGHVGELKTDLLHVDPSRFQYKIHQTDAATGSVGSLAGVKRYDPELGGVLQVWRDPADGKTYVVNGHNRLDLARKLGAEKVTTRFIDAPDATQARAKGALTNIAEGRGTSTDAAKFFRDTGISQADLDARGIPMREHTAKEGLALAGLSDKLFRHVSTTGELSPARGAIIGGSGLEHHQQEALHDLVGKEKRTVTDSVLKQLTDTVRSSGNAAGKKGAQSSLFGDDDPETTSLAIHKARIQDAISRRLATEKKLFGTVAKSRAAAALEQGGNSIDREQSGRIAGEADKTLQLFDQFKNLSGPVSAHLNHAAVQLHAGHNEKAVIDEHYRAILKDFPAMLGGSLPGR